MVLREPEPGPVKDMLELARAQEGISLSINTFDSKGHYLGVHNGAIDLRTGQFVTGDERYYITKETGVEYQEGAQCPAWEAFLLKIMEDNRNMVAFLRRLVGQAMLGLPGKDKLAILYGTGANGKSTFVDTLNYVLGNYAAVTDPRVILEGKQNAEYYLAPLKGVRLLLMSETKKGASVAEDLVKMIVDSGEITGRYPHGRVFQYQPVFTPILSTNHKPRVSMDYAIWRRIFLIPFNYTIPEAEKDPNFRTRVLQPEAAGILNWCIAGCLEYQRGGLSPTEEIIAATAAYREEQDKLGQFIEQCCEVDLGNLAYRTEISVLRKIYEQWCIDEGLQASGSMSLRQELANRGHVVKKGSNGRVTVYGLRVYGEAMNWLELNVKLKKRRADHLKLME
jgi:putative DNA primase/helicase